MNGPDPSLWRAAGRALFSLCLLPAAGKQPSALRMGSWVLALTSCGCFPMALEFLPISRQG